MALNDLIAQGAQFQTPNLLQQYSQMQQLQSGQQQNALNQMKMTEMTRGLQEQEGLRNYLKNAPDLYSPEIRQGVLKFGDTGLKYGKSLDEAQKAGLERNKSQTELVGLKLEQSRNALEGVTTPEQYLAWHEANHRDPVLADYFKSRGVTADTARGQIEEALRTPGGFEKMLTQSKIGVVKAAENLYSQQDLGGTTQTLTMPKYGPAVATVVPGSAATKTMTPGQVEANRIAQGNLDVNRGRLKVAQDAADKVPPGGGKPMTELQRQKLKKDMAADSALVKTSTATADELEKLTDELVGNAEKGVKAHPGLGGITGWSSLVGSFPEGDASKAAQKLETFKGKIAALGRQMASQQGKLGNMAVQEWKIVADAVQNIKPSAGNLDEQMREVVRQAREFANRQKEAHDLAYENEQVGAAPGVKPATMTPRDKEALDWANKNPNDPRAVLIKQLHGG